MKKITLLCLLSFAFLSYAQIPTDVNDKLNHIFDSLCAVYKVKGSSAAMLVPDWGIWKRTWGVSHAGKPIDENMIFCLGSNTKTYTSSVILRLHQDGILSINDTIGKWIINVPNVKGNITIKQLLQHTSGIANYTEDTSLRNRLMANLSTPITPEEILPYIRTPLFVAGTGWSYSNTNYLLAGIIIKKALNKSLAEAYHQYIFTPLNLTKTILSSEETTSLEVPHHWTMRLDTARMTDWDGSGRSYAALNSEAWAAGGIYATAEDNALFFNGLFNTKSIMADSMLTKMRTFKSISSAAGYGLGLFSYTGFNGRVIYNHGGTFYGTINENVYDPGNHCILTILTNQDSISNNTLRNNILGPLHKYLVSVKAGIDESHFADLKVQVYPNPSHGNVRIDLQEFALMPEFTLYDISGKKVFTQKLDEQHNELRPEQEPGLYFYTIHSADGRAASGRLMLTE